jgi:hypothetical protein
MEVFITAAAMSWIGFRTRLLSIGQIYFVFQTVLVLADI